MILFVKNLENSFHTSIVGDTTEARASFSALLIAMTCFFYFLQFALFEEFLWGEDVQ